jgi:hypothetical protein
MVVVTVVVASRCLGSRCCGRATAVRLGPAAAAARLVLVGMGVAVVVHQGVEGAGAVASGAVPVGVAVAIATAVACRVDKGAQTAGNTYLLTARHTTALLLTHGDSPPYPGQHSGPTCNS